MPLCSCCSAAVLSQAVSDFNVFGPEDIDAAFEKINTLKHYQQLHLVIKGVAISIEGRPAGHMVGGTVWVVESGGEVAVYGVDTNHMKERWGGHRAPAHCCLQPQGLVVVVYITVVADTL